MPASLVTAFPGGVSSFGIPQLGGGLLPFSGNYFFVNPDTGADGNPGPADLPMATIAGAFGRCQNNHDDVILLVGSTTTNRLAATLNWNKDCTHLIGVTAPTQVNQRARISNDNALFFSPLINVTAQGCMFANFSLFMGFVTPATQVLWKEAGQRNYYGNVSFNAFGSTQANADAGSRSIIVGAAGSGNGEHTFEHCFFGGDTLTRGATTNANIEFIGGTPRNTFRDCTIAMDASSAGGPVAVLAAAAASVDRWNLFERCRFINAIQSGATAATGAIKMAASAGGLILVDACTLVGISNFGFDATSKGQIYMNNPVISVVSSGTNGNGGEAINPA